MFSSFLANSVLNSKNELSHVICTLSPPTLHGAIGHRVGESIPSRSCQRHIYRWVLEKIPVERPDMTVLFDKLWSWKAFSSLPVAPVLSVGVGGAKSIATHGDKNEVDGGLRTDKGVVRTGSL